MDIMTGLAAVSETLKITKEIRNADAQLDKADLKLRLADLIDGLLEAKEALQDAKQHERELLDKISALEEKLKDKDDYEDEKGLLYRLDDSGKRFGEPYCHHCYVKEEKLFRLIYNGPSEYSHPHYWCENHKGSLHS